MVSSPTVARSVGAASVVILLLFPATGAAGAAHTTSVRHESQHSATHLPGVTGEFPQVSAVPNSTDAWAVGTDETNGIANLIGRRHHGKWRRAKLDFGSPTGTVSTVAPASAKVVWAAGTHGSGTLLPWIGLLHRNTFKPVQLQGVSTGAFYAMSASSAKNAWAVGHVASTDGTGFVAEHWNGTTWSAYPVPDVIMTTVSTTSPTNAWATAGIGTLLHWNGKTWAVASNASAKVTLTSVTAGSATNVIAVGYVINPKTE